MKTKHKDNAEPKMKPDHTKSSVELRDQSKIEHGKKYEKERERTPSLEVLTSNYGNENSRNQICQGDSENGIDEESAQISGDRKQEAVKQSVQEEEARQSCLQIVD